MKEKSNKSSLLAKSKKTDDVREISLLEHTKAVINVAYSIVDVIIPEISQTSIRKQVVQAAALHDIGKCSSFVQKYFRKSPAASKIDSDASVDTSEYVSDSGRPPKHNVVSWAYAKTFTNASEAALIAVLHHHIIPKRSSEYNAVDIFNNEELEKMHMFFEEVSAYANGRLGNVSIKSLRTVCRKSCRSGDVSPFWEISPTLHRTEFDRAADAIVVRSILIYADRIVSSNDNLSKKLSENDSKTIQKLLPVFNVDFPSLNIENSREYDQERLKSQTNILNSILKSKAPASILSANAGYGKTLVGLRYIVEKGNKAYWVAPQNNIARNAYMSLASELNTLKLSKKISLGLLIAGEYEQGSAESDIIVTNIDNFFNPAVRNSDAMNFMAEFSSTVVFDEYHKFLNKNAMFAMFIQLMYARFHHMKTDTLLMSATPLYFEPFFWNKDTVKIFSAELFNCDMMMRFHILSDEDCKGLSPADDSFIILPTVELVQNSYASYMRRHKDSNASIIHALYTDEDRAKLEDMMYKTHGKNSDVRTRQIVYGSNLISTGLDVSANNVYDFPICPEDTIQKGCGRAGRFAGEYDEVNYFFCNMKKTAGISDMISDNYNKDLLNKWENILKSLDEKSISKKEVYEIYHKFYEDNAQDIKIMWKLFFRFSNSELCTLRPYAVNKKLPNHDVLSSRVSWRGPGDTIYSISRFKDEPKTVIPDNIVKITTRRVEYLDSEWSKQAWNARCRFLESVSDDFKNKFRHGNKVKDEMTKETFYSYGRKKETPFLLYKSYYDDELGLVIVK